MARALTTAQRALLRASAIKVNLIATLYLDAGTYRFCDDIDDLSDGTNTWIGANALTDSVDIRSGTDLSAEGATLICDGQRMAQFGIADPARVLKDMLGYLNHQRRVDLAFAIRYPTDRNIGLTIPVAAMKINNCRLIDPASEVTSENAVYGRLEINLDSLAARYQRATFRVRSNTDQLEIDPTDKFFSFTENAVQAERTIYWGKNAPYGSAAVPLSQDFGATLGRQMFGNGRPF
jgi:hypothetical protein